MRIGVSILIAGAAGALIGGFAVGVTVYFWTNDVESSVVSHIESTPNAEVKPDSKAVASPPSLEDVARDTLPFVNVQTIQDIASLESDYDKSVSIYFLLAQADVEALERYIDQSTSLSSRNQRNYTLSNIIRRYAALDPQQALDRVLNLDLLTIDEKSNFIRSIFNEWTVSDRDEAAVAIHMLPQQFKESAASSVMWRSDHLPTQERMQLARQIGPDDSWISRTLNSIRRETYREDPRSAFFARIGEKTRGRELFSDLSSIADYWFEQEGTAVIQEISESIQNAETRRSVIDSLVWRVVQTKRTDPSSILDIVMDLPNKRDAQLASENALNAWAMWDPQRSFETSLKYDDQLITRETRSSLLTKWARESPEELFLEATAFPQEYREIAVVEALGQIAFDSPEEAIRLVSNLDSSIATVAAKREILSYWSINDAKSAFEWYVEDSVDDSVEEPIRNLTNAFQSYLNQDFESAVNYVNKYEGKLRSWFVQDIATHLIHADLDRAIEYLPNVEEESRDWILGAIGFELSRLDPFEAISYGETIELKYRKSYFQRVLASWAEYDLMGLHNNIQKVPLKYRAVAAMKLLNQNDMKHFLNEREIQKLESMISLDRTPNPSE